MNRVDNFVDILAPIVSGEYVASWVVGVAIAGSFEQDILVVEVVLCPVHSINGSEVSIEGVEVVGGEKLTVGGEARLWSSHYDGSLTIIFYLSTKLFH